MVEMVTLGTACAGAMGKSIGSTAASAKPARTETRIRKETCC